MVSMVMVKEQGTAKAAACAAWLLSYIYARRVYVLTTIPSWDGFGAMVLAMSEGFGPVSEVCRHLIIDLLGGVTVYRRQSSSAKRRYARACDRVLSGVLGRDVEKVKEITLTTRYGEDNSWVRMRKDVGKLVRELRKRGVEMEYCLAPELSPGRGLMHVHGVVYLRKGDVSLFEVQVLWAEVHGATQVSFKAPGSVEKVKKYMVSHMFKAYDQVDWFGGRMLVSRGWMPEGWQFVSKVLNGWAVERDRPEDGRAIWDARNEMYRRWLWREKIVVRVGGAWFILLRKGD